MVLGLTGGLGCGKSTAANLFTEHGWRHIDSDAIVRQDILHRENIKAAVGNRFGSDVLNGDGNVNRKQLADVVFSDDESLRWLEDLTHPLVFEKWREMLKSDPQANWVVEVPLLFEKHLENWFDFTVCVSCAPAQQLTRLEQHGLIGVLAVRRISKQLPLARKIELSDFVLLNDGSIDFLRQQIDFLVDALPHSTR